MGEILGIHHVTAICGPAQENLDFYSGVLGLRLVKLTVNFDDPGAYHLYFGDGAGSFGTILTFFPYPEGHPGRPGSGQATVVRLAVPSGSIGFWVERFRKYEIDFDRPSTKGGHEQLGFRAPDGLQLELVAGANIGSTVKWAGSPIPPQFSIYSVHSVLITVRELDRTKTVLEKILGFNMTSERNGSHRFELDGGGVGKTVDILIDPTGPVGRQGHGGIHHVAFRTPDEETQLESRLEIVKEEMNVSAVMDRDYFKSIYFREPGGVLLEVATESPGFTVDESLESLGRSLKLPKQYEPFRLRIERELPTLVLPRLTK